jgi:hypothetical protein
MNLALDYLSVQGKTERNIGSFVNKKIKITLICLVREKQRSSVKIEINVLISFVCPVRLKTERNIGSIFSKNKNSNFLS